MKTAEVRRAVCALLIAAAAAAAAVSGCRMEPARDPAALRFGAMTCRPQSVARLYLGSQTPDRTVDDGAFQSFVDAVVTPRFANGFTVLDARGQWRGADGALVTESSRVLEVVGNDDLASRQALAEVVAHYKLRFSQAAVLVTQNEARACL